MIFGFLGFLIGVVLGSFVKVLADRGLKEKSFLGRSYCESCKKTLSIFDLIPLISFISLKGKCRYCKNKISMEYPLVEALMGILIAFLFWKTSYLSPLLFFQTFFITILISVLITDLKEMLIPDRIILPSIGVSIIYLLIAEQGFLQSLITGLAIAGFFLILIIITRGKGMGGGDVKLGLFLGLGLGFPNGLLALMLSFFSGSLVSILLIFSGKKKLGSVIAFGPFLVLGSLLSLFWGQEILNWYLHF